MSNSIVNFAIRELNEYGFSIVDPILSKSEVTDLIKCLEIIDFSGVGTRSLLTNQWCVKIAEKLKNNPMLRPLLPNEAVAVQCTYFNKSAKNNWLVPYIEISLYPLKGN